MTSNITTAYECNDVIVSLCVSTDYDSNCNLPYKLAEMFHRIIEDSEANPDIIINELRNYYSGRKEVEQ